MASLEQSDLVLGCEDDGIGLGLGDFLFGLQELGVILLQLVVLLAGIKGKNNISLFDHSTGACQFGDLQGVAADGWCGEHELMAGMEFSGGMNLKVQ